MVAATDFLGDQLLEVDRIAKWVKNAEGVAGDSKLILIFGSISL